MENCAFVDIFTTQNDLYGKNNCPIQFNCEIFTNEEIFEEEKFLKNPERRKFFKLIPDEKIMPMGSVISGISNEDVKTSEYNGIDLKDGLNKIYALLNILKEKNLYIAGFNHVNYDLKILNENFRRILCKEPIVFPKDKILDVYKLAEQNIDVYECGGYSTDALFTYFYHDINKLTDLRMVKSTVTDTKLTKMIFLKMINDKETFSEFYKRMTQNETMERLNFGKYKGALISEVMKLDLQYLNWVLNNKIFKEQSPYIIESVKKIMNNETAI